MPACMTICCYKFNQLFDFLSLFILNNKNEYIYYMNFYTGPRNTVCNVSGNRCESDSRSRGHEFDAGPVPYFRGD